MCLLKLLAGLFFLFLASCSSYNYSLLPDDNSFFELQGSEKEKLVRKVKENKTQETFSVIHSVVVDTIVKKNSFEHVFLAAGTHVRLSLYAPNFSRQLFYAVSAPGSSISCDMVNKEAVVASHSDKIYLPEMPSLFSSVSTYKSVLFATVPESLFSNYDELTLFESQSDLEGDILILRGKVEGGLYESVLRFKAGIMRYVLEKTVLFPETGKDVLEISYDYGSFDTRGENEVVPSKLHIKIRERSLDIYYDLKKISFEISGEFETLFSLHPPAGYRVYAAD